MQRFIAAAAISIAVFMTLALTPLLPGRADKAPDKAPDKRPQFKFPRGHIEAPLAVRDQRHRISNQRYGPMLKALPVITATTWDSAALGLTPAINNQGSCGDCYLNSAAEVCATAQVVSGTAAKGTGFNLSVQYLIDCHRNLGGCGGGDEYEVSQLIQASGAPGMTAYPGAGTSAGRCQSTSGMTLYTVNALVMCSAASGVADTQDIKNCIAAYGAVSVAVAAGSDWDNYAGGNAIITGTNTDVNHAVLLVGWDDTKTPPCWKLQNSWGTSWGNQGYCWIAYGADQVGTEAFSAVGTPAPSPPPAPPPTPTPTPPAPGNPATLTLSGTGTAADGKYEMNKVGTMAGILKVQSDVQTVLGLNARTAPFVPVPAPEDVRINAVEKAVAELRADIGLILKTLEKMNPPVEKK